MGSGSGVGRGLAVGSVCGVGLWGLAGGSSCGVRLESQAVGSGCGVGHIPVRRDKSEIPAITVGQLRFVATLVTLLQD